LLEQAGVAAQRRERARRVLLDQRLGTVQIGGCWLLRLSPAAGVWVQLRHARIPGLLAGLGIAHTLRQGLQILGWWLIAEGALSGRIDTVWLSAWGLVLLTSVPFELLTIWNQSRVTIGVGQLLKQRLLFGSLQLRSEEVRHQGIGQFLGRVLEAETLETLVLGGGFAALVALIELGAAVFILSLGAGGWPHGLLLVVWFIGAVLLSWRYYHHSQRWRHGHRLMINALVERMVGHRTRLAQQPPEDWHREEDQALTGYLQLSQTMDRSAVRITGLLTRGWLLLGLLGIAYPLLFGQPSMAAVAISLGGILLAGQAFTSMSIGVESLVGVFNAWRQVGPLFHAATRGRNEAPADGALHFSEADTSGQPLLIARDLVFRYREHGAPVLQGCDLRIHRGDRLLLEGPSGGGKSTLAALLTGLRIPSSGLLLLRGLDRQTLGSASWRRRVVAAPQFHENHVLTETLAFNLLMGRRWPPTAEDLEEAEALCRELGLGPLLERMPAGLHQLVGESGWQLSHGERSRLYIARALLQGAELVVLDESFAALDPENLERALRCVLRRAPTLLVIAHP
jgi:ATP-binding cassette, subfamily B, bacterial